jgi:hypothetical protein
MLRRALLVAALLAPTACSAPATATAPADAGALVFADTLVLPDLGPADDAPATFADAPAVVAADAAAADAGAPPTDLGPPIVAPANQWTWVDVPGSRCANGAPTGFGINPTADPTTLLIFLQGGGACWDALTCLGPVSTSFYVGTGYDRVAFATDVLRPVMLPLQRANPGNPWRQMNMVYVPYCTGDVHAGDRVAHYNLLGREADFHHVGARNLDLFLARIRATWPAVRRVWLAGDSAGGFGVALNMDRVQRALPAARVDVVDDSGPPIEVDAARWRAWRTAWNLQLPAGCPASCGDNIGAIAEHVRATYPDHRFGLISYSHDAIISTFVGIDALTFNRRLTTVLDRMDSAWAQGRYFVVPGLLHVGFATPTPALSQWLQAMVFDDPRWASVRP